MRALRWGLVALGALLLVVVAIVVFFVATFDPNAYKPRIVELVKRQTGRALTIDGPIGLTLFPKLGAAVGIVGLSEPNSPKTFARVEEAHVAVALLPLLRRRVIVDRVTLRGLSVDLVRHKDGTTNFDDLTGRSATRETPGQPPPGQGRPGPPLVVDVGGLKVDNATIGWRDERDGTDLRLSHVALETGRLASGVTGKLALAARVEGAKPKASLAVDVSAGYRMDLAAPSATLSSLDARVTGDAPGVSGVDVRLKGETVAVDPGAWRITLSGVDLAVKAKDGLDAKLAIPRLEVGPDRVESAAIAGEVSLATAGRTVSAKLRTAPVAATASHVQISRVEVDVSAKQEDRTVQGTLAMGVALDLERQQARLSGVTGDLSVSDRSLPGASKATVNGGARADWGAESASAELAVKLDESSIDATVSVAHWSRPAIIFDLTADRLNVDRYRAPARPGAATGRGAGTTGASPPGGGAAREEPFDLSALKTLDATGSVRIGALQVSGIKAQQVAATVKARAGRLDVDPISASVYQGTLAGSVAVNASDDTFIVKQRLAGVGVGPLVRDAADKDLLEGRGTVVIDVTTGGNTVTRLKKGLGGTARLAVTNGVIKGVDLAGIVRAASLVLDSRRALERGAEAGAKTEFSELGGSFVIRNGVAHNEDLRVTSALLQVAGRGDIDIGEGTMDYAARVSLTSAAAGLGGKDLARFAGVPVPVRATGPLGSPKYSVDVGGLATEFARRTLQRELERHIGGSQSRGQPEGAGAVGDLLRGLFGKPK